MIPKSKSIVKREPNEHFRKFLVAFSELQERQWVDYTFNIGVLQTYLRILRF